MNFIQDVEKQIESEKGFRRLVYKLGYKSQKKFFITAGQRLDADAARLDSCEERANQCESELERQGQLLAKQDTQITELDKQAQFAADSIERLQVKVELLRKKLEQQKAATANGMQSCEDNLAKGAQKSNNPHSDDKYREIDYFDFENHFRGSRELIKERQSIYLPYFEGCHNVVDLGCGRGEFLELMGEHNIPTKGVDTYEEYVELCRQRGYSAEHNDAVSYLEKCEDESIDGIFLGQVVEHLELSYLIYLCELTYKKAKPGAHVIMETPNPMCLAIFSAAFYVDPSHNKPVHPLLLQYLMEKAGFKQTEILFTEPSKVPTHIPDLHIEGIGNLDEFNDAMKSVNNMLFGSQDYAIIATRD